MIKSKKYFLVGAIIFVIILALIAIDMSNRTVAPWERSDKKEANE